MRILTICYEYPPIGGGGAPACQGVCESLVRQGHHVDVVTSAMRDLPMREVRRGVYLHRVRCLRRHRHYSNTIELLTGLAPAYHAALKLTKQNRYDVIHCHFAVPSGLVARAVSKASGVPYILTAHGSDIPGYNPDRFNAVHELIGPVWRSIIKDAAIINTPSDYLRKLLQKKVDVPVKVIPYGFNPPASPNVERQDRVIVVTRMFERKGVQHVIEAMSGIDTNWQLCIVGDGPYLPTLKAQAAESDLEVMFTGYVQGPKLVELYHSAKVFALPSASDNFPVVLLEAMAAGCAVVTTSGTGCAEVIGEAGLTVEPNNVEQLRAALTELVTNPDRVNQLSQTASQHVQRYLWSQIGSEYEQLYLDTIGSADTNATATTKHVELSEQIALPPLSAAPLVTVMMANYDYGEYIGKAIQSVLDQTYTNWQLLVCDDGSTDDSIQQIRAAAADDPRIEIFEKPNGGQASAWNHLWPHVKGELLCLLDSDDEYEPEKLATVVGEFRYRPEVGLMVHRLQVVSTDGSPIQVIPFMTRLEQGWIADRLIERGGRWRFMPTSGLCMRREVAEPLFPIDEHWFQKAADCGLFYSAPMLTPVYSLDQPLTRYRVHGDNASGSFRYTPKTLWHDLHSIHESLRGSNDRLEALGRGRPFENRHHLSFRMHAYSLARLWGRRGAMRGYVGLMRAILADDLYSLPQKLFAVPVYGVLAFLPRRFRSAWLNETIGVSWIKRWLQSPVRRLRRMPESFSDSADITPSATPAAAS